MKSGFKEEPAAIITVASGRPPNSMRSLRFRADRGRMSLARLTATLWGAFLNCGLIARSKSAPQRVAVKPNAGIIGTNPIDPVSVVKCLVDTDSSAGGSHKAFNHRHRVGGVCAILTRLAGIPFVCWLLVLLWTGSLTAADHIDGFDSATPSWQPIFEKRAEARLKRHRRNSSDMLSGEACEELQIVVGNGSLLTRFEQELPPSAPIEDVALSVAFRSNVPGCLLALRMVFPHQIDPRTGRTLTWYLPSDEPYQGSGRWQTLTVQPTRRSLTECVVRLRAKLKSEHLQLDGMFFDRAVLFADLRPGTSEFLIDDLSWTGYAAPATFESRPGLAPRREIVQTKAEEPRPQFATHVTRPDFSRSSTRRKPKSAVV